MSTPAHALPATKLTRKGRATRDRIVSAAADLMLQRGAAGTSIEDVKAAAEVSSSQLYHYFADKQALILAVVGYRTHQIAPLQPPAVGWLDSFEALEAWRDLAVSMLRARVCVGGCPLGTLAAELVQLDLAFHEHLAESFGRWEANLAAGLYAMQARGELRSDADPARLALATLAAFQGGALLAQVRHETTPVEVALDAAFGHIRSFATA